MDMGGGTETIFSHQTKLEAGDTERQKNTAEGTHHNNSQHSLHLLKFGSETKMN